MNYFMIIFVLVDLIRSSCSLTITTGHCYRNVTVKYQVPITKTRVKMETGLSEYYVEFEERVRVDALRMCCNGYRTLIFGLCEPICTEICPENSYCAEPEKCLCIRGYEESHNHHVRSITTKQSQQLQCRPVCAGGCPPHSHCVGHNQCACRLGFKDASSWFSPMRCERILCPVDQVYDVVQHKCVLVDMNLEELMQQVGRKLTKGINTLDYDDDDDDASRLSSSED